jgi:DMSO/TMAO reductase YedYZ heme-binding membrane subunit
MMKLFLLLLFLQTSIFAHQTGLSYIDIKEDKAKKISVIYKKPLEDTQAQAIALRYPLSCVYTSKNKQLIEDGFIINSYELWCGEQGLSKSRIWVEGLVRSDRGVMIHYSRAETTQDALLRATTPFVYIDKLSSRFELFYEYANLGIEHIWSGYDHLLFVSSLILLSLNLRALLFSITAFTLSHSVTLAFGILGIINVGAAYIEAMIALSIVFLARELTMKQDSFTKRHLGIVAFIFGLLHGFGFSSVLRTIGLPQEAIPLSLFSFNLGIEIGQVLFILVVSLLLAILKKYVKTNKIRWRVNAAYIIGAISSYWLIERVLSF